MGFAPLANTPIIKAAPVNGSTPVCEITDNSNCAYCYDNNYDCSGSEGEEEEV